MAEKLGFFMLVDAGDNDVHKIREELLAIADIHLVHCLIGPTDLICYGRTKNLASLKRLIRQQISELQEVRFNPIQHTETLICLEEHGLDLAEHRFDSPGHQAAWVFADSNLAGAEQFTEKLIPSYPEIKSVANVLGSHDLIIYVEAENLERLMTVIDDGIRVLRGIGNEGESKKALTRTDTRLVLMRSSQ